MDKQTSSSALGFSWEPISVALPREDRPGEASFVFQKNRAGIVWNSLGVFENNPSTLPQTETILQGEAVGGISIDQLTQVKRFGEGAACLIEAVRKQRFQLTLDFAKELHAVIGREEALEWGVLRSKSVHIRGISHIPPEAEALPALAEQGFAFLRDRLKDPIERAIAAFLFMSRSQFFFDCNKRTASLLMNGVLLSEGFYPISVLRETAETFNEKLSAFYNSGEATDMFRYFAEMGKRLYP